MVQESAKQNGETPQDKIILTEGMPNNKYNKMIKEAIVPPKEYMDAMQKNYPNMSREEIIEAIEKQKNYTIYFHHHHEGITEDLIKKYLIIDTDSSHTKKLTLETLEIHDCNLVELSSELQDKAYRGYRGDRDVISHLINRKDYPGENKTKKLTIIGKRNVNSYYDEETDEQFYNEYFYVVTAFRGDGSAMREPKEDYFDNYNMKEMEYWMNHALIPENNEKIRVIGTPYWMDIYYRKKKQEEIESIYKKGKDLEYQAFTKYVKDLLVKLGREYDKFEIINKNKSDNEGTSNMQYVMVSSMQYVMVSNKGKFGVIRVDNSNIIENCYKGDGEREKDVEEYKKEIMEKDYIQNFKAEIIKDINHQDSNVPQEVREYRKAFISRKCNNENLREIIKATEKIKHKVDIDKKGNKLSTIILGNKEYKILEPNLEGISDDKYSSYATESYTNIQKFKRIEADLDGMRGNNPDERLNKKLANYIKTKELEGFTIPGDELESFLSELGEKTGIEKIEGQLLMLMYLTGMDGNYWYSMDGGRIKCEYPMFWSNVGNVSGGLLLMSIKELKE